MLKKDTGFYTDAMLKCLGISYSHYGNDIIRKYSTFFPNALVAINGIYSNFSFPDFYGTELLSFENPQYVYEVISAFLPSNERIMLHVSTSDKTKQFNLSDISFPKHFDCVRRIDLMLAVFLFVEDFILQPVTSQNVILTDTTLAVYGKLVTFEASKHDEKTYIFIRVEDVLDIHFVVLN